MALPPTATPPTAVASVSFIQMYDIVTSERFAISYRFSLANAFSASTDVSGAVRPVSICKYIATSAQFANAFNTGSASLISAHISYGVRPVFSIVKSNAL